MGCGASSMSKNLPQSWMDLFAAMQLKKSEVKKLYKIFTRVDLDGSGSVDIAELLTLLDIERTRFTEQVFTVFDSDGSGKVDFKEFVLAIWNYCTIGQASLDIFAFDMYDRDKSGKLSLEEVHQMLKDLYGKNHINDPKVKAIEHELEKINDKAGITVDVLKKFAKNHQNLLYPVFKLQHHLQENVLGANFWIHASQRRVQLSKGKYVTLEELMQMHMDPKLYSNVMKDASKMNLKATTLINNTGTAQNRNKRVSAPPPTDYSNSILPTAGGPPPGAPPPGSGKAHNPNRPHQEGPPSSAKGHDAHAHGSSHGSSHGSTHGHHHGEHHSGGHHHHHHGAVLKNTSDKQAVHASGHHYSDGKVHAGN